MAPGKDRPGRIWPRVVVVLGAAVCGLGLAVWWWHPAQVRQREARTAIAKGREHLQRGRPARALQAIADVPEDGPWGGELLAVRGLALAALDRPEAARRALERALERDPNQPMAAKVLAAAYLSANEVGSGLAMLETAARLDPGDFRPWYAMGEVLLRNVGRPEDAIKSYREALRRRPDHPEARLGLIDALLIARPPEEATPWLDAALRDGPDDPKVLALAARHARNSGRAGDAARYVDRALARDPDHPESLLLRAQLGQQAGRLEQALADAERAVALEPNNLAALNLLALIEATLGLKDRAAATAARHKAALARSELMQRLTKEIDRRPGDPGPRWRLGQVAAEAGLRTLAIQNYRSALYLDPHCRPALDGLAALGAPRPPVAPDRPRPPS